MLKKRKAQGLPITVIVVAVIALLVIVVLVAVFSGRMGQFGKNIDDLKQGSCSNVCASLAKTPNFDKTVATCTSASGRIVAGDFTDIDTGKVCCCT